MLLGSGTPMLEDLDEERIGLETIEVIEGADTTHLHFRVADRNA